MGEKRSRLKGGGRLESVEEDGKHEEGRLKNMEGDVGKWKRKREWKTTKENEKKKTNKQTIQGLRV